MSRKLFALVVALVLTLFVVQPSAAAAPVRIMPLGDSITAGPGCWRALLWDRLQRSGYTDIDFVGTQVGGGCSVAHDGDHEGHGGFSATGIADQNQLPGWLSATNPQIVLMHLGTNDLWGGTIPTDAILAAYTKLVGQMRANNPDMKIIVAQLIPMEPANCTGCAQRVVALNAAIPGWAAGLTTSRSPITVVDQWTGFSAATDTFDGVHPVDSGFQKMSDRWYPAVATAIGGTTPPVDPPPTGTCTADYRVTGQWNDGFQGEVTVHNVSTRPLTGWTVTFTFGGGQRVTQAWNATVTQSGATVAARNVTWNGAVAPGGSTAFGFLGSWTGTNQPPAVTCTAS